jgi:hypothetical protein
LKDLFDTEADVIKAVQKTIDMEMMDEQHRPEGELGRLREEEAGEMMKWFVAAKEARQFHNRLLLWFADEHDLITQWATAREFTEKALFSALGGDPKNHEVRQATAQAAASGWLVSARPYMRLSEDPPSQTA